MAFLLEEVRDFYNRTLENGDARVAEFPLMANPWPTLSICLFYVYFVKVIGPALMKNREPFNIRWLMVFYNFAMVIVSVVLFVVLGKHGWFGKYNWKCQPIDYSESEDAMFMVNAAWWYYFSKYIEFSDTIFFVLRKKFSQVSTLHVIHHGVMPMSVWWGVKFTPGGHSTFFAFINSFVHILMYFYYGLAAIGPQMSKYLWWKKYMTGIQMIQFIMIFVHSFQLLFIDCNYPRGFMWWIGFHAIMFWFLFYDFFHASYVKTSARRAAAAAAAANGKLANGRVTNGKLSNGKIGNGVVVASCEDKSNGNAAVLLNGRNGVVQNGVVHHGKSNGIHKPHENGLTLRLPAKNKE